MTFARIGFILFVGIVYTLLAPIFKPTSAQVMEVAPRAAPNLLERDPPSGEKEKTRDPLSVVRKTPGSSLLNFDDIKIGKPPFQSQMHFGNSDDDCPLSFLKFDIHHYRLAYQHKDVGILTDSKSPLHYASCAQRMMSAGATEAISDEGIHVTVTDPIEFVRLFDYVLNNVKVAGAGPPPLPPTQVALAFPSTSGELRPDRCERSAKVCMSTKDRKISVEFTIKCDHLPEFTFSTEAEASVKLGPITVSIAAP